MPKRISAADATPIRVVLVTMDSHLSSTLARAGSTLARELPGLRLDVHSAAEFAADPAALQACIADIERADIVLAAMLFMEEHFMPLMPALTARRDSCDAMICFLSASEVTKLTRMGRLKMDGGQGGPMAFLKRLRGSKGKAETAGSSQMRMLRRLPKLLRFVPGAAQDLRAWFIILQYWLSGSDGNALNMIRYVVDRYADGPRRALRGVTKVAPPVEYPEVGVYHPALPGRIAAEASALPRMKNAKGTVGLLLMRSYALANNSGHYDAVIAALEKQGLSVTPAFASGLDARPAMEKFFFTNGRPNVDVVVSLTGFSLVGGPAYNDAHAAEEILARLDAPLVSAHPVEFQTLEQWRASDRGLMPVEATMMVAIPELDGAIAPSVFGGRTSAGTACAGCERGCSFADGAASDMRGCPERADALAERVARLAMLRRSARAERRVGIVLFNFPPNAGAVGTAAYLSVFESLFNCLRRLRDEGYSVDLPDSVEQLRERVIVGNARQTGAAANVHARIGVDDHVRRERFLREIEAQWGPAPGKHQSDGASIHILGERFGNVFVGVQPAFGYEGDPMRLLFEKSFAPTHAFSAFYRWLREDFGAYALLHFGTHGALEFMPGKQAGMSGACWPERLIGAMPNLYLYASNNPSEGALAKRRAAATLVSYLTPSVTTAGLYRGLLDLKASLERWRDPDSLSPQQRADLAVTVQAQASSLDLAVAVPQWENPAAEIDALRQSVLELEYALIPHGLHVVGATPGATERADTLLSIAQVGGSADLPRDAVVALCETGSADAAISASGGALGEGDRARLDDLGRIDALMRGDGELEGIVRALDGRYIRPAPGGDLMRTPAVLPTGRNLHGFDPFRIPSAFAVRDGARQAAMLIERHRSEGNPLPECVAVVLWGSDNLKTEGAPLAQALALLGARPRLDSYGRVAGAELIPLSELQRPRIDIVATLSGIFRDLLPVQVKLLAQACHLAAAADEPLDQNFVRKHALAYQQQHNCDLETAALRVFSNAEGAYGANVNHLIDCGRWNDEDELAEAFVRRKGFAYDAQGKAIAHAGMLKSTLASVDLAYQNLDSVELGVTTIDNYFDTLGGISRAVRRARGGEAAPVYVSDQTQGAGAVRTLSEQVALETRTRMLNPKWYESMLSHGYEGVRQIEAHLTNTMGWSATTGEVQPWVYQRLTETFVLDPQMRERLATLNPTASARLANRLLEAHHRNYWSPDEATLADLRQAGEELEDRLEGVDERAAA
ncbi:MAG: magnesium chelatase subunit H [Beijerinckiaceae bacterium]